MKIDKSLLSGSTPTLVLALLKDGDKYGYQMIEELARRSDDTFQMKEGTLYPLLHTLEKERLVESYIQKAPSGRDRKYYRLTRSGREEQATMTTLAGLVVVLMMLARKIAELFDLIRDLFDF